MKRTVSGLIRLGQGPEAGTAAREAKALARLEAAWPLVVGTALAPHTRPLRVRHHTLVMGCWRNELIPSLRASAAQTWPSVQERLEHMLSLKLARLEVVPCDPPLPPDAPAPHPESDPLKAVLQRLRALRNARWTPPRA